MREFADRGLQHAHSTLKRLSGAHTPCELYVVHGHYADAGEVAALMSSSLGIDMVLTGHSLGRNKLEHLLASGGPRPCALDCLLPSAASCVSSAAEQRSALVRTRSLCAPILWNQEVATSAALRPGALPGAPALHWLGVPGRLHLLGF